jgi:hypothetical protein
MRVFVHFLHIRLFSLPFFCCSPGRVFLQFPPAWFQSFSANLPVNSPGEFPAAQYDRQQ